MMEADATDGEARFMPGTESEDGDFIDYNRGTGR